MVSRVSISAAAGPGPASSIGLIERRVLSRSRASGMGERPTTRATVVTNGVPREPDSPDFGHFGARLDEIWSLQAANSVCSLPRACGEGVGWGRTCTSLRCAPTLTLQPKSDVFDFG